MGRYNLDTMTHILESTTVNASPQQIWGYVQEYRRRAEWDVTTLRFEPLGTERIDKDVRVFVRTAGGMEYEGVYVSYEPYRVSAVKMTRPIRNIPFRHMAGSWRYKSLEDGQTEFTMTFDYEVRGGFLGQIADKLFLESAMRRGMRSALVNLQKHFGGQVVNKPG